MSKEHRLKAPNGKRYTVKQIHSLLVEQDFSKEEADWFWSQMKVCELRFHQGDRVLCNVGERRLVGTVLSVDEEDPEDPGAENVAYVVKTDAIPGFEARTISAPVDHDGCICRERCFEALLEEEANLARWAAPIMPPKQAQKPLRFKFQDRVCIRAQDNADGYENWLSGEVVGVWPNLPGKPQTGFLVSADRIPYKVMTDDTKVYYCHRDDHTLIRKAENMPRTLVKTISKRFEHRRRPDGTLERFDHITLRSRKGVEDSDDDDMDPDKKRAKTE